MAKGGISWLTEWIPMFQWLKFTGKGLKDFTILGKVAWQREEREKGHRDHTDKCIFQIHHS